MPANLLYVVAVVALALSAVRTVHIFRARSMRALAARRGFRYIGPSAPPKWWWNPPYPVVGPSLPAWISRFRPSGHRMRQVWNVIEGQQNGVSIIIFDSIVGDYRGGQPCTLVACRTEQQSPFGTLTSADRIVQSHGWTVLHGAWFLWFSWTMGAKRIESHLNGLQAVLQAQISR